MTSHQVFDDTFEATWSEFDTAFKKRLLSNAQRIGSLHRDLKALPKLSATAGLAFYRALDAAANETRLYERLEQALSIDLPSTFDDVHAILEQRARAPMHAFFLLLLFIAKHPVRAFFSGRDEPLPVNTLHVSVRQPLNEKLPVDVSYSISGVDLEHCPANVSLFVCCGDDEEEQPPKPPPKKHPKNHFWWDNRDEEWGIWTWHF